MFFIFAIPGRFNNFVTSLNSSRYFFFFIDFFLVQQYTNDFETMSISMFAFTFTPCYLILCKIKEIIMFCFYYSYRDAYKIFNLFICSYICGNSAPVSQKITLSIFIPFSIIMSSIAVESLPPEKTSYVHHTLPL